MRVELPCIIAAVVLFNVPAHASSKYPLDWFYLPPSLDALVGQSSLVAIVTPGKPWVEKYQGLAVPVTVWHCKIGQVWHKEPLVSALGIADSLTVFSPGGQGEIIPEAPMLDSGVDYVAFLEKVSLNTAKDLHHFRVTQLHWGIGMLTPEGVIKGGAFDGEKADSLRARVIEASIAKSPEQLLRSATAVVFGMIEASRDTIDANEVPLRVTSVSVAKWIKGEGKRVIEVTERSMVLADSKWDDKAYLPIGEQTFMFLEKRGSIWRLLGGECGLYVVDPSDQLFAAIGLGQSRYVGITRTEMDRLLDQRSGR